MAEIRIETIPGSCVADLDDGTCPDGATVSVATVSKYTVDAQGVTLAIVALGFSVPVNMFSTWLYEKLKQKKCQKVKINKRNISLEAPDIQRAIEEAIKQQETRNESHDEEDADS